METDVGSSADVEGGEGACEEDDVEGIEEEEDGSAWEEANETVLIAGEEGVVILLGLLWERGVGCFGG